MLYPLALKTCSVLEPVPRYELGTYQPIGQWPSHCTIRVVEDVYAKCSYLSYNQHFPVCFTHWDYLSYNQHCPVCCFVTWSGVVQKRCGPITLSHAVSQAVCSRLHWLHTAGPAYTFWPFFLIDTRESKTKTLSFDRIFNFLIKNLIPQHVFKIYFHIYGIIIDTYKW